MSSIFEFIDYRKFLQTYYNGQKEKHAYFSYRYFANKAGINSSSFLKHVIDGKRNLTRPVVEKFCQAMKLTPKECVYFRNLVLFNQAKTAVEKQEHYAVLCSMAGNVKELVLNSDLFDYFSEWYTPVIRELVTLYNFKDDYKLIASMVQPPIQPSEAKAAIELLLRLKLLSLHNDGSYQQENPALVADANVLSRALQAFSKTMIDHSKYALENETIKERHISGLTMGISPETYSVLEAEIEAFKDRIKTIVNRDQRSSVVYQLNLALFPVSRDVVSQDVQKDSETC